jgi:hypothetical protein
MSKLLENLENVENLETHLAHFMPASCPSSPWMPTPTGSFAH